MKVQALDGFFLAGGQLVEADAVVEVSAALGAELIYGNKAQAWLSEEDKKAAKKAMKEAEAEAARQAQADAARAAEMAARTDPPAAPEAAKPQEPAPS